MFFFLLFCISQVLIYKIKLYIKSLHGGDWPRQLFFVSISLIFGLLKSLYCTQEMYQFINYRAGNYILFNKGLC